MTAVQKLMEFWRDKYGINGKIFADNLERAIDEDIEMMRKLEEQREALCMTAYARRKGLKP